MDAAIIAIFCLLNVTLLLVGGIIGWLAQQNNLFNSTVPTLHPEMYDEYGNVLPDEILAVRFENDYDDEEAHDED
ncbi:MAG: hypothetical protein CL855_08355 [Cryomorphaceae bacterium]|nr:hypothetical protein [Cryomorphaceae bacterium]|tara:strand:- start:5631 stop:5855 length:225 start_codon:yes stop_codon:yes gene_type:complete